MLRHNIIVAKRDRDEYLECCLRSIDEAANRADVDVCVYVIDDENNGYLEYIDSDIEFKRRICVRYICAVRKDESFNKSRLLNQGFQEMRGDYDFVSIVDVDMILNPVFFQHFELFKNDLKKDSVYHISEGVKLIEGSEQQLATTYESIEKSLIDSVSIEENKRHLYPSQITLSKNMYEKLLDILKTDKLYHEGFVGWGGEDSYLSFFSRYCEQYGLLRKVYVPNMWYHVWHPRDCCQVGFDKTQYDKNVQLLHEQKDILEQKVRYYRNSRFRRD